MKIIFLILLGIFFISFVSAVPVINEITMIPEDPLFSEYVTICAEITDDVSEIVVARINLYADSPPWVWGLILDEQEEDVYCKTMSPYLLDAYIGKEISYYVSGRNILNEVTTSDTYYFNYSETREPEIPEEPEPSNETVRESSVHTTGVKDYCEPNWGCGDWSSCKNGIMRRNCYDSNHCDYSYNKPNEIAGCEAEISENASVKADYILLFLIGIFTAMVMIGVLVVLIRR